jgi:hypothetical protein
MLWMVFVGPNLPLNDLIEVDPKPMPVQAKKQGFQREPLDTCLIF